MTVAAPASALDVRSPAGRLEAEMFAPPSPAPMAVILGHGLPSGSLKEPDDPGYPGLAREIAGRGLAAVTFSFRGCYGSEGDLSFAGWVDDLRAVVDAVSARTRLPVAVAASSMGGAAALVEAQDDDRVEAVATLAAPADFEALTGSLDELLGRVRTIGLIRTPGFPSDAAAWAAEFASPSPVRAAARLGSRPLLVLHGAQDDVVPPEHARRIVAAAEGPVTHVMLKGAGHQLRRDPLAVRVLFAWIEAQASRWRT